MARNRSKVVGSPILADSWQALFFDVDEEGRVDKETVEVVRVACWAGTGSRIVGLIPTEEGLAVAEDVEFFRGYVDAKIDGSLDAAIEAWDGSLEDDEPEGD